MHELGLAESIVQIARKQVELYSARRVNSITLLIGDAVAVEPDSLRFGFEVIAQSVPELLQAALVIRGAPHRGRCRTCSTEFEIVDYSAWCPACGAVSVDVISGNEFQVLEMDIEQD